MRRFIGPALAGSLVGLLVATSAAAFPAETLETAELLQGPAYEFDPIVELPAGTEVEVLNCDAEWCEVSVADYDGFLPRQSLDLGDLQVPRYVFPPEIAAPDRWHGRYYSREHYRYESRARWRDREGRRLFMVPPRVLQPPQPLRPLMPQPQPQPQFQQKQFQPKGPGQPKAPPPPTQQQFQPKQIQPKQIQPKGPPPPPPPPSPSTTQQQFQQKQLQPKGPPPPPPPSPSTTQQQFQKKQIQPPPPPPPQPKGPPPKKKEEKKGSG